MAKLTVQNPDAEEVTYELTEPYLTLGRNDDSSIAIVHGSVSGSHAELTLQEDGSYALGDSGSANGTFVNGQQITDPVLLPDYAEIVFGQVQSLYYAGAAEASPAAAGGTVGGFTVGELATPGRPGNFLSISPFPKNIKKKDPMVAVATLLGTLAILVSIGLVAMVFLNLMSA